MDYIFYLVTFILLRCNADARDTYKEFSNKERAYEQFETGEQVNGIKRQPEFFIADPPIVRVNEGFLFGKHTIKQLGFNGPYSYYSFKKIPYAEPPIGKLRFKAPQPAKSWHGIRNATEEGSLCTQPDVFLNVSAPGDEDCLFLNIYTPSLSPEKKYPVIFFIHGGGFQIGDGNDTFYSGEFIVQMDCILVTHNYRLGAFGFLQLDTKNVPGNAGLKDQNLALKWVQNNIHNFGGDRDNISIMGQSAGSASVVYHMLSPMSKGLFKRAIALSGVPFCEWATSYEPTKRSFVLGKLLGKDTDDPEEMLEFLQSVPPAKIADKYPIVIPEERHWKYFFKMSPFTPATEKDLGQERFLVETPIETLKRGNITPVDLMIGYTNKESLVLIPEILGTDILKTYNDRPLQVVPREVILYGTQSNKINTLLSDKIRTKYFGNHSINLNEVNRFITYDTEMVFHYNINRFVKHLPDEFKTFLYRFSAYSIRNIYSVFGIPFGITGAAHADELNYLFNVFPNRDFSQYLPEVKQNIQLVVTLFTNFAKYGNPIPDNSSGTIWQEYNRETKCYVEINDTVTPGNNPDADAVAFWTDIYRTGGVELP